MTAIAWTASAEIENDRSPLCVWMRGDTAVTVTVSDAEPTVTVSAPMFTRSAPPTTMPARRTEWKPSSVTSMVVGATILETASHVTYRLGTFVYWAIAMICVALDYQSDLKDREIRTSGLERLLSEARLATLRSQLDPHFLFNTLNSISAYVESAPRQARLMIEQLGDLLRSSLEHADQQEIPLECELTFIDRYIQLQLVRFADRLDVDVRVDPDVMSAAVSTFLLQPLVENAIHHGTSKLSACGVLELSAWRSGESLHVRVRDNGPGLPPGWSIERHSGLGLRNTRARLEHLFGKGHYSLEVTRDDQRGTCVDVIFPYRVA